MRKANLLFIHMAIASLLIWWAPAALPPGTFPPGASILWTITFGVLGFFTAMVFGMGYLLVPAMLQARLYRPGLADLHLPLAAGALGGLAVGAWAGDPLLWGAAAIPWCAGGLLFLLDILLTIRHHRGTLRRVGQPQRRADLPAIGLTAAAGLYLPTATVALILAHLGPPLGLAPVALPSALHLYLLGFVANMIFGVGHHLMPRFLGSKPHRALQWTTALLGIPGPALVAYTMAPGQPAFLAAALAEGAATTAFALNLLSMFLRRSRRLPPSYFVAASAASLLLGPALGVTFAADPRALAALPVHMRVNLVGFASFMIFGVAIFVFPFFPRGRLPASYARTYMALGLGTAGLVPYILGPSLALLGLPGGPWVGTLGALLLFASALAFASSIVPSTLLIWRTRSLPAPQA